MMEKTAQKWLVDDTATVYLGVLLEQTHYEFNMETTNYQLLTLPKRYCTITLDGKMLKLVTHAVKGVYPVYFFVKIEGVITKFSLDVLPNWLEMSCNMKYEGVS